MECTPSVNFLALVVGTWIGVAVFALVYPPIDNWLYRRWYRKTFGRSP